MPWLTSYDWLLWSILLVVAGALLHKPARLPLPLLCYVLLDVTRDLALAWPAHQHNKPLYCVMWWTFMYADYAAKIWLLVWAAMRVLSPVRILTFIYAGSGTLTLAMVAWRIGWPWHPVEHHTLAMILLAEAANVLCCFLGLYVVFMVEDWPQPEVGVALGVLTWAAGCAALGALQLHGHNTPWVRRGYPWPEMAMLAAWWWAIRPRGERKVVAGGYYTGPYRKWPPSQDDISPASSPASS